MYTIYSKQAKKLFNINIYKNYKNFYKNIKIKFNKNYKIHKNSKSFKHLFKH